MSLKAEQVVAAGRQRRVLQARRDARDTGKRDYFASRVRRACGYVERLVTASQISTLLR
jgi:hypothetical protein